MGASPRSSEHKQKESPEGAMGNNSEWNVNDLADHATKPFDIAPSGLNGKTEDEFRGLAPTAKRHGPFGAKTGRPQQPGKKILTEDGNVTTIPSRRDAGMWPWARAHGQAALTTGVTVHDPDV